MKKLHIIQKELADKKEELKENYGAYVDTEMYLINGEKPKIPDNLNSSLNCIQRVEVLTLIEDLYKREKKATNNACLLRDECTELKCRCRELEDEKEGIR